MPSQISFLLILFGITGIDSRTTVSKVSVKTGGSISIPCRYDAQYRKNVKYLCKGYYWNYCSYAIKSNQGNSSKYSIFDDKEQGVFTVTINDLTDMDSDYWCNVEINAGRDVGEYFHLSVTSGTPRLYVDNQFKDSRRQSIAINCSHGISGQSKWCQLGGFCITKSGLIDKTSVMIHDFESFFTVTMNGLQKENSGWYFCVRGDFQMPVHLFVNDEYTTSPETIRDSTHHSTVYQPIIIALSVLMLLVIVTLFIWFLVKRYVKRQMPSAAAMDEEEVTYTVVNHRIKPSKVEATEENVVYSSLSQLK